MDSMEYIQAEFRSPSLSHLDLGHEDVEMSTAKPMAGGAFGDVYRGRSRRHRNEVAVKRIRAFLLRDETKAKASRSDDGR